MQQRVRVRRLETLDQDPLTLLLGSQRLRHQGANRSIVIVKAARGETLCLRTDQCQPRGRSDAYERIATRGSRSESRTPGRVFRAVGPRASTATRAALSVTRSPLLARGRCPKAARIGSNGHPPRLRISRPVAATSARDPASVTSHSARSVCALGGSASSAPVAAGLPPPRLI